MSASATAKELPHCSTSRFTRGRRDDRTRRHDRRGKSTLVNLLSRFYEYDGGEIVIDGKPLRAYGTRRLRQMVASSPGKLFV
jgi:hypothetical protein